MPIDCVRECFLCIKWTWYVCTRRDKPNQTATKTKQKQQLTKLKTLSRSSAKKAETNDWKVLNFVWIVKWICEINNIVDTKNSGERKQFVTHQVKNQRVKTKKFGYNFLVGEFWRACARKEWRMAIKNNQVT